MQNLYIEQAILSGYKSIENIQVDFQNGLNIIIGKNAAGKTNFLKFLQKNLIFNFRELNNFSSSLRFDNGSKISIKTIGQVETKDLTNITFDSKVTSILKIGNKTIKDKKDNSNSIFDKLRENKIVYDCTFICHGIPKNYPIVDQPFTFVGSKNNIANEIFSLFTDKFTPYFLRSFAIDLALNTVSIENLTSSKIKENLNRIFKRSEKISQILSNISPIEDVRVSQNYNVFIDKEKESFTISNLFFEFKIRGNWLPFSSLSDGTRRLFYIVSEVLDLFQKDYVRPSSNNTYYSMSEISRIILIEEPELGIHPHQFQKLMNFLKDESNNKQIILTTHSPQALDAIDHSELKRIIIAYTTNNGNTELRHLSEPELAKAADYIKEDFLSDYWLYSDLEK